MSKGSKDYIHIIDTFNTMYVKGPKELKQTKRHNINTFNVTPKVSKDYVHNTDTFNAMHVEGV